MCIHDNYLKFHTPIAPSHSMITEHFYYKSLIREYIENSFRYHLACWPIPVLEKCHYHTSLLLWLWLVNMIASKLRRALADVDIFKNQNSVFYLIILLTVYHIIRHIIIRLITIRTYYIEESWQATDYHNHTHYHHEKPGVYSCKGSRDQRLLRMYCRVSLNMHFLAVQKIKVTW